MSTVLRLLGYRFYWYSNENGEPIHIHVRKENRKAKFWLSPISLARNDGFATHELTQIAKLQIAKLLEGHVTEIMEKWNEEK